MTITYVSFRMHQGTGVRVRAFLNDVPFHRSRGDKNISRSGPANHLFVPGENAFRVEIDDDDCPPHAPTLKGPVLFELRTRGADPLVDYAWKTFKPPVPRVVAEVRFHPPGPVFEPVHLRAEPAVFGPEGTAEQRTLVLALHHALATSDVEAFWRLNTLRAAEQQRAYPGWREVDPGNVRADVARHVSRPWAMRPLDPGDLVFESYLGGRVAYVLRKGGGYAIEGTPTDGAPGGMMSDLWLTRVDGVWQIFR